MASLIPKNQEKIKSILEFLEEFPKKKILSSYLSNTLSLCNNYFQDHRSKITPDILNEISTCLQIMEKDLKILKSEGFFAQYGLYEQNQDSVDKVFSTLNKMIKAMKPIINEDVSPLQFGSEVYSKIDDTVNAINRYIKSKNEKSIKKLADKMKHELTYMFWMRNLSFEDFVDIQMFQNEFKSLLTIFDLEFESFNIRLILDEIDKERLQIIIPNTLDEFFGLLWTMPNDVYKLRKGQKNLESELLAYQNPEKAGETLRVRKKVKKSMDNDNISFKSLKKSEVAAEDEEDQTLKIKKVKGKKLDGEEQKQDEKIDINKSKFLIESIQIVAEESILLKVIETCNQDDFFVLGRIFVLNRNEFSITEDPTSKKQYQSHGLAKFGRGSNITEYQSDLRFNKSSREISRRQFQINMNDYQSFSLQCVSPNETYFKIHDVPFSLMSSKRKLLYFGEDEIFLIKDVTNDYIIFSGISTFESSETKSCSYTFNLDSSQREWRLGEDNPLKFEKIKQFGCKLIFSDTTGWTLKGISCKDPLFKKKFVKLTVNTIDNINNGVPSSLVRLEEGMIINIEKYSLLVFRII